VRGHHAGECSPCVEVDARTSKCRSKSLLSVCLTRSHLHWARHPRRHRGRRQLHEVELAERRVAVAPHPAYVCGQAVEGSPRGRLVVQRTIANCG